MCHLAKMGYAVLTHPTVGNRFLEILCESGFSYGISWYPNILNSVNLTV